MWFFIFTIEILSSLSQDIHFGHLRQKQRLLSSCGCTGGWQKVFRSASASSGCRCSGGLLLSAPSNEMDPQSSKVLSPLIGKWKPVLISWQGLRVFEGNLNIEEKQSFWNLSIGMLFFKSTGWQPIHHLCFLHTRFNAPTTASCWERGHSKAFAQEQVDCHRLIMTYLCAPHHSYIDPDYQLVINERNKSSKRKTIVTRFQASSNFFKPTTSSPSHAYMDDFAGVLRSLLHSLIHVIHVHVGWARQRSLCLWLSDASVSTVPSVFLCSRGHHLWAIKVTVDHLKHWCQWGKNWAIF